MKTFVAEEVLSDWTSGMIVVKAIDINQAMDLIIAEFPMFYKKCDMESCELEYCLQHRLRELKDNEIAYVYGGG
jgi:antirestriction protein